MYLVQNKYSKNLYALKVLEKNHIIRFDKIESVFRERNLGEELSGHPNIVQFEATFQDEANLYFLIEYIEKGSLQGLLRQYKSLPGDLVKFYAAELVSALEYMHSKNIAHRDLKPDNILISNEFHLKLTDFGEAKKFEEKTFDLPTSHDSNEEQTFEAENPMPRGSFVGTPLYVAPEMLSENSSGTFTDLWALGCIIYQMRVGHVPFNGASEHEVF